MIYSYFRLYYKDTLGLIYQRQIGCSFCNCLHVLHTGYCDTLQLTGMNNSNMEQSVILLIFFVVIGVKEINMM